MSSRSKSRKASDGQGRKRKPAGNPVIVRAARAIGTVLGTVVGGISPAGSRSEAQEFTPEGPSKEAKRKPSRRVGPAKKRSSKSEAAKGQRKKRRAGR